MNHTKIFLLAFAWCINIYSAIQAQSYSISFQQNIGNPGSINTETDNATSGWTNLVTGNQVSNFWSSSISIPFSFLFYGQPVTDLYVSQNGLISFELAPTALSPNDNTVLPSTEIGSMTICAFWDEFTYDPPTPSTSVIRYKEFGTAPNRQLWIKWSSFEIGTSPTVASWACVLEETSNKIYIVDMNSFSGGNLTATIGVQFNNTKAVCYNNTNLVGFNDVGTTNYSDNDVYTFSPLFDNDVKLESIDNPTPPFNSGVYPVNVTIRNLGLNTLTNCNIHWSVNGVNQTTYNWTGSLISTDFQDNITIGTYNFVSGSYLLKVWTSQPNGQPDQQTSNDTLEVILYPALCGTYTIGGSSADFPDFVSAAEALNLGGISCPVVFNVNPGFSPYVGQVNLQKIQGSSSTNTITFNGSANKDTLQFSASLANNTATLNIDSCSYITFNNLSILASGSSYGIGVKITNLSSNIYLNGCKIITNQTATLEDFAGIAIIGNSFSTTGNFGQNIHISNCTIYGGYYGIIFNGTSSPLLTVGNFSNNQILNAYMKGIAVTNGQSLNILNNQIQLRTNAANTSIGIDLNTVDVFNIEKNEIQRAREIGIKINNGNFQNGSPTVRARIVNNMVGGGFASTNARGIQLVGSNTRNIDIWHNSVSIVNLNGRALEITGGSGVDVRNNSLAVFGSTAGYALYVNSNSNVSQVNYNNYYTQSSSNFIFIGTNYNTANYVGGGGFNANSKHGDPGYANNQTNLHARRSQLNDSGVLITSVSDDIDGDTRPLPPGVVPDIGADEFNPPLADLGVSDLTLPLDYSCGKTNDTIIVTVKNYGLASQSNIPGKVEIYGAGNQVINFTIPGPIAPNATATHTITTFNTNLTGTYYVRAFTLFPQDSINENDTLIKFVTILKTPSINAQNVLLCDSGSAVLSVTPEPGAEYVWYNAPNGTALDTGTTFTTPVIYATTSYFVQGINRVTSHVGPADSTLGTGQFTGTFTTGTTFNVYRTISLDTVVLYSQNSGNAVINLKNSSNTIINSVNYTITGPGRHVIPLGFVVSPGTNYRLDLAGSTSSLRLYQNNSGALYPYSVNNVMEITGNTVNQVARYFYFYDWVITINSCESNFVPVTAIVGQSPNVNLGPDQVVCDTAYVNAQVPGINNPNQYVWNTGFVGPFYKITTSGEYFVEVTASNGCKKRDTINVTILNSATVNLGNDTTLACGDSLVINLGTGASYEWSTGDTTSSLTIKQPGVYSVRVYQGLCESRDTIVVNFSSFMTLGNDTTVNCGTVLTLTPSLAGDTYLWSTGDTSPNLTVDNSGIYWVEITKGGCILKDTIQVSVQEGNLGWVTDTSACLSLNLDASTTGAISYEWSTGDVSSAITVTTSGVFWVHVTLSNGCIYKDTINVTIDTQVADVNILVADTLIQSQSFVVQADTINPAYTYLWNFGTHAQPSTATGAGPHTVSYDTTGIQTIQLIVISGCGSDTTVKNVYVVPVSNTPQWKSQVLIYPNPFHEQVYLQLPDNKNFELKIYDLEGKPIQCYSNISNKLIIYTKDWSSGIYILQLQNENQQMYHKLVKP